MAGLDFNVAYSGLNAAQKGIQVTQNNITNMNTEGYARQELILKAQNVLSGQGVERSIGMGVINEKVNRVIDEYLVHQARAEKSNVGYYESMEADLTTIENYFNDNSSGSVTALMGEFFDAWEEVSKFPEESSYRTAVISAGELLVNKFAQVNDDLKSMAGQIETDVKIKVNQINTLVEKIENVNKRIAASGPNEPNSLYDERDSYLDELSKLTDVKTKIDENNPRIIDLEIGGITVLTGLKMEKIEAKFESKEQEWIITSGNRKLDVKGGSLKASLDLRNEELSKYTEWMDELSKTLIRETNEIYEKGYDANNATGKKFFEGESLTTINLNSELKGNPDKLAISSKIDTAGNSDIAKEIYDLSKKQTMSNGTTSMIGYYNGKVIDMAAELNSVKNSLLIHESMSNNVESNRQVVQGVNMDEELGNLMKFQQYYAANSKVINTIDELYDTLLNMI